VRRLEVLPYHDEWPQEAAAEAARFASALAADPRLLEIHHIGSTAVPGLAAKPTLDLLPVVTDLACLHEARAALEALGYQWRGESEIPNRRYFPRSAPDGIRLAHVHCFPAGDVAIHRHLAFRDYLRAHPDIARAYAALKLQCAQLHPHDGAAYTDCKATFVHRTLTDALAWAARDPGATKT
jgi:GrpB-like predicted nucleotidyltransferase (UPF0157 family)